MGTRFTELVGCELPIQQAGMGGAAVPRLVVAVCEAGGLGTPAQHGAPPAALETSFEATRAATSKLFAFNVLMPFVNRGAVEAAARPDARRRRTHRRDGALRR